MMNRRSNLGRTRPLTNFAELHLFHEKWLL
jgi:hypothetical protein